MEALTQLSFIWLAVFISVIATVNTRLTPVLFYLAAGFIMVNSGILPEESDPFIRGFSEIGIIVIMFALGFEESGANFIQSIKRSWGDRLIWCYCAFCHCLPGRELLLARYKYRINVWSDDDSHCDFFNHGILAHYFGFHPAVGAYMAGLILREEYFDVVETDQRSKNSY